MTASHSEYRVDAAIAIVVRNGLVLISRRKAEDVLGGYWEFPGGACEAGETLHECVVRELIEELDVRATPQFGFTPVEHSYTHGRVRLHPFLCAHESGEPKAIESDEVRWIAPADLREYRFPPANEALIEEIITHLSGS
ncbi:MAG: (deoxy)nucleoside triphosphate pyrophosphohydrolase [Tepidisphaeraceae bacterium]